MKIFRKTNRRTHVQFTEYKKVWEQKCLATFWIGWFTVAVHIWRPLPPINTTLPALTMFSKKTARPMHKCCRFIAHALPGFIANHCWVSIYTSNEYVAEHSFTFFFNFRSSIEHAGCASCFIDSTASLQTIRERLIDFQTNIVLCDLKSLDKLHLQNEKFRIAFKSTLFDAQCAVIQFNDIAHPDNPTVRNIKGNHHQPSEVFFYASTSGSCGDSKTIGVTYKCFMPNITSLG